MSLYDHYINAFTWTKYNPYKLTLLTVFYQLYVTVSKLRPSILCKVIFHGIAREIENKSVNGEKLNKYWIFFLFCGECEIELLCEIIFHTPPMSQTDGLYTPTHHKLSETIYSYSKNCHNTISIYRPQNKLSDFKIHSGLWRSISPQNTLYYTSLYSTSTHKRISPLLLPYWKLIYYYYCVEFSHC